MRLNQKSYLTAIYLRLSQDDGEGKESNSIKNQRTLIHDYVRNHEELKIVEEYVDDGYSGANFNRPAFLRMIEDAKRKKINCIVVKDLSRFGRNYIEAGRYLEDIFPLLGIRFIAINDHYDTAKKTSEADQIIIPFKNLINDAYCRDISIKVRSSQEVKRKKGEFIGNFAVYGYLKDPENKHHLIVDEYAAEIVRYIFNLKLDGCNEQGIADNLNEMGVLTPMEYKCSLGMKFNSGFRSGEHPIWRAVTVKRILKNEMYTGMMVQGKNRKINYKVEESIRVEDSEWYRVADTHEAIISKNVFDTVQKTLRYDTRTSPGEENLYPFSGLLRCGDCGQNMIRRSTKKGDRRYFYYHCSTYKNRDGCSSHMVSENKIDEVVLDAIQNQIKLLVNAKHIVEHIETIPKRQYGMKTLDAQLVSLEREAKRYRDLTVKLYEDFQDGVVGKEEYANIQKRFSQKQKEAEQRISEIRDKQQMLLKEKYQIEPWIEELKKYANLQSLERKVLVTLIDRIVVYGKDRIEICFHHGKEMKEFFDYAEAVKSEQAKEVTAI